MDSILETEENLGSNADIKLKIKFFNASVVSLFLHATNSYVIGTALQSKISAFQTQCLRNILNINKKRPCNKRACLQINQYSATK